MLDTLPTIRPAPVLAIRAAVVAVLLAPLALAVPALLPTAGEATGAAGDRLAAIDGGASSEPASRPDGEAVPSRPSSDPLRPPVLGVAMVVHHIGDLPLYLRSVDRIAELGANALNVVTPMFQPSVDSSSIAMLPDRCPTDRQLVEILTRARERGLRTMLQPIVLLERPGDSDWRGVIRPDDWSAWWTSYEAFLDRYLAIAEAAQVDVFCIGSELNSTEPQVGRWRRIAERVRSRFDGPITYSANWDRFDRVHLWPMVDFMSVSSYFELVPEGRDASVDELVAAWADRRDHLLEAAARQDRDLLLAEAGYPSLPWAATHPWNYVAPKGQAADHDAQARCYEAFFAAWREAVTDPGRRALGFFCYHWDPYRHGQASDTGYGFAGKPSERIIREAFADLAAGSASGPGGPGGPGGAEGPGRTRGPE